MLMELFLTFARVGLFTFGGGYAMISMITKACVTDKKWLTHDEMMDITVIAESTPGPIAINCATYVGYKEKGMAGAVTATLGMILPSFAIIYVISLLMEDILSITLLANALKGIRIAAGILILDAAAGMIQKMQKKLLPRALMLFSFIVMMAVNVMSLRLSSVALMLCAGLVSVSVFRVQESKKGKEAGNDAH